MLQRNGKTEARGKKGKGVICQVAFPVDLLLMAWQVPVKRKQRLTGPFPGAHRGWDGAWAELNTLLPLREPATQTGPS